MWDQRYGQDGWAYGTEPNDFLRSVADRVPPGPVLCLAEGQGRNAVFMAGRGHRVVCVDSSAVGMARAAELAASRGLALETHVADLGDFDLGSGWSGIIAIFAHFPESLRLRVHRGVVQALAPGGVFILEAYAPGQIELGTGGPPVPELLYDLEMLRQDLAGLELLHAEALGREVVEGRYHTGPARVVQVLGRKPDPDAPRARLP